VTQPRRGGEHRGDRRREQRLVHARAVAPQQRAVLVAHSAERAADGRAAREVGDGRGLPAQPVADADHADHLGVELRREAARRRAHASRGRRAAHEAPPGLWRVGGGDLAGGAGTPGEVGVVGVAEGRHGRAGLVVVGRGAGLGWDVAVGHVRDDVVERGDEPVVDLLAAAQGLVRHRGVGAGEDVVQRGAASRADRPLVHGNAGVPDHTGRMFQGVTEIEKGSFKYDQVARNYLCRTRKVPDSISVAVIMIHPRNNTLPKYNIVNLNRRQKKRMEVLCMLSCLRVHERPQPGQ
jgi:hypothetical protein